MRAQAVQEPSNSTGDSVRPQEGHPAVGDSPGDLEPMTFSLLGRFFAVPLLIIASIVGGAVVVVLLFAGPASPEQRSIESLLMALESGGGERSMGLLLTKEKEHWQTALELSLRLEKKDEDAELTATDLQSVAVRLGTVVRGEIDRLDRFERAGLEPAPARADRSRHLEFVIRALGRTGRIEAVDPLLDILASGREPYVTVAMLELGELHTIPESRKAIGPILDILKSSDNTTTQLIACTVLSVLGRPHDQGVIDALTAVRLSSDGEVAWSAALALARLGSPAGKSTLLDLLDRSFLESGERYQVVDEAGRVLRYPLPPQRVEELLMATMDAASNLDDAELWEMIARLESDPSPTVRARASARLKAKSG